MAMIALPPRFGEVSRKGKRMKIGDIWMKTVEILERKAKEYGFDIYFDSARYFLAIDRPRAMDSYVIVNTKKKEMFALVVLEPLPIRWALDYEARYVLHACAFIADYERMFAGVYGSGTDTYWRFPNPAITILSGPDDPPEVFLKNLDELKIPFESTVEIPRADIPHLYVYIPFMFAQRSFHDLYDPGKVHFMMFVLTTMPSGWGV